MSEIEKLRREYKEFESLFLSHGLSWDAVERVGEKALLTIWDIFELFKACKTIPDNGFYLEIGSHLGGSLCVAWEGIRVANRKEVRLLSVDPFVADAKWCETYEKNFNDNTTHIPNHIHYPAYSQLASEYFANDSIDLIFVDGDHTFSKVKTDLIAYWAKLKVGGQMLVHDYNYSPDHAGVIRAIMEVFQFQEYSHPFRSNLIVIPKVEGNETLYIPYADT